MTSIREGGCLCGAVRYRLEGEPFLSGTCHCATCRKESGSMFVAYAKWPIAAFRFSGEVRTHGGRSFCPECGSRLFNLHEADVEIRLGSLDDAPMELMPLQEGWVKRREPWLMPVVGVPQYWEDPPALTSGLLIGPSFEASNRVAGSRYLALGGRLCHHASKRAGGSPCPER